MKSRAWKKSVADWILALVLILVSGFTSASAASATDIVVNLSDNPDPVIAGANLTYNIRVTNNGPNPATNVTLTNTLPAGVIFVSATPSQGSCSGTSTITCNIGSLTIGSSATVAIVVRPTTSGAISNSATVTASQPDSNTSNNTDTEGTTVTVGADLSVTKSDSPDPVVGGANLTYTITASNAGPFNATNITVRDTLPSGVTFVSASGNGWTCTQTSGVVTCTRPGPAATGAMPNISIVVKPNVVGTITNTVTVYANQNDPNTANNTVTQDTTVQTGVNVSITQSDSPDPVAQGNNITYILTPRNNGPQPATSITVTDTLPAGVTFVSASGAGWTCTQTSGVVTCTRPGPIASGTNMPIITIVATANTAGTATNTANVSAAETDPETTNNTATANTTVQPVGADLSITKTDSPDPVAVGSNVTYTLTARNNGPSATTGIITVTDSLPAGVTYFSASGTGWTCSVAGSVGTQVVTCTRTAAVNSNTNAPPITIFATATSTGNLSNQACVSLASPTDPNTTNNCTTAATVATSQRADLVIAKSGSPDPVVTGDILTYTIEVTNNGPNQATGVTVTDALPNSTFVSAMPSQGTCSGTSNVTCNLETIDIGGSATITIQIRPTNATSANITRSNTASVSSTGAIDPNNTNNSATIQTIVTPSANLSVTQTDAPDPVLAGTNLTYVVTARNNGPSQATNVTVTDTLPPGVTFVSATPSQGTCTQSGGTVNCNIGTLNNSAQQTVTIVVMPTTPGSITNNVSVSATQPDPISANNSNSTVTVVNAAQLDLLVNTSDDPDPVALGNDVTYTVVVTNNGPSRATDVVLTNTPPAAFTLVSVTPSQGSCSGTSPVNCNLASLANGASATVTMVMTAVATGSHTNNASVTSNETDTDSANNSVAETTTSRLGANLSVTKGDNPDPVTVGSNLTYTLTVSNAGPANSLTTTLTDNLPTDVTLVSVTPSQGTCSGTSTITCNLGTVNTSNNTTVTIVVKPTVIGNITNTASVTGSEPDPNTADNSASQATTVTGTPNLRLVKRITRINGVDLSTFIDDTGSTDDNATNWPTPLDAGSGISTFLRGVINGGIVLPGDVVEYTIYFLSDGSIDATNVKICDLVPANTTFIPTAFNNANPKPTDGGLPTDLGIALAIGSTTPTAYLTNVADAPDRGQFFSTRTQAPAACNSASFTTPLPASSNLSGTVVVDVVKSPTTLPKANAPGTPSNSYGFIRFQVRVN